MYVPRNWGKRCAPYCMLYVKHKSCEAIGYIKVRPIISHAGHPLQRLGTQMSRALSVLVDRLASMPENSEAFTMPDVLQHFRHVHDSMLNQHGDTGLWELGELDLEDMFLNIDKGLLLESFDYMIERLDHFAPPGNGRYPSRCKSVRFVSISTIDKKFDCLHQAPGMDTYHYIPVATLRDFVDFELRHGGGRQPMCDPEGCSTVWGAVGGGGPHPPPKGGGDPSPPPWLTQTQHLFRQAPSKRANT